MSQNQNTDALDDLLGTDPGHHTDYEVSQIFSGIDEDSTEPHHRLVHVVATTTETVQGQEKVSTSEHLSIEWRRASTLGGFYTREQQSIPLPSSRAERVELLTKLAMTLGLDARFD